MEERIGFYLRKRKKHRGKLFLSAFLFFMWIFSAGIVSEAREPVVIVIDPGHGGENLGGQYAPYTEKEVTLSVARAMKEELEKYEDVTVYLTRESDVDLSLDERVNFAAQKNADFLFCLHFNMSATHRKFGAEVWVSAFGEHYSRGYEFARIEMDMLTDLGLYSRGIKTKLNDRGTDYYGILRHAREQNVPCALIEHCHLDQENDRPFVEEEGSFERLGKLDATAAARYFGLKSEELGVDYGGEERERIPAPAEPVKPDKSEPEICRIEVKEVDEETGKVSVELAAEDGDSYILYYDYSLDGGRTYSDLRRWDGGQGLVRFDLQIPSGSEPEIVCNAYNGFDVPAESNHIQLPLFTYGEDNETSAEEQPAAGEAGQPEAESGTPADAAEAAPEKEDRPALEEVSPGFEKAEGAVEERDTAVYVLVVCLVVFAVLLAVILATCLLLLFRRRTHRRRRQRPETE